METIMEGKEMTFANATKMYFVQVLSSLHVGVGQGLGYIDLPIQREKVTKWPLIPGTAVKGVLRDVCRRHALPEEAFKSAFGTGNGAQESATAGALAFSDAHIVALPVRSLYGTFAYVSCPLVLSRLQRDLTQVAHQCLRIPKLPDESSALVFSVANEQQPPVVGPDNTVFLEEFDFRAEISNDQLGPWVEFLITAFFSGNDDSLAEWRSVFSRRFVVVSDSMFQVLSEQGTEVQAHVRIDDATGTVANGALWYEESLPAETLFSGILSAESNYSSDAADHLESVCEFVERESPVVQLGGKASTGKGRCKIAFLGGVQ